MADCPNTALHKRGRVGPVRGWSWRWAMEATVRSLRWARTLARAEADEWLSQQLGSCPRGCKEVPRRSARALRIGTPARSWIIVWFFFIPIPLYVYVATAEGHWDAWYICRDHDNLTPLEEIEAQ